MEKVQKLISVLKVVEDNIKILHHNLIGAGWLSDHPLLGDYYEKVGDIEDSVIEMAIMCGGRDTRVADAVNDYENIQVREYTNEEAFALCMKFFMDIVSLMDEAKEELPDDCISELETHQYWFRLEAKYKIAHRLANNG